MKKGLTIIIVIIIILAGLFIVLQNMKRDIVTNSSNGFTVANSRTEDTSDDEYMLMPSNIISVFSKYKGSITKEEFGKKLYKYVEENTDRTSNFKSAPVIQENTIVNKEDSFSFVVKLTFKNSYKLLSIELSNTDQTIMIGKYNEFDVLKGIYNGNYNLESASNIVERFISSIDIIYSNSKTKSLNKIAQYYDLNKGEINSYGIYDRNSYLYIAEQTMKMLWTKKPTCDRFEVEKDTFTNANGYSSVEITLYYTTGDIIKAIINIPDDVTVNQIAYITSNEIVK